MLSGTTAIASAWPPSRSRWVGMLLGIVLVYPLLHNTLLYTVNVVWPDAALRQPWLNLVLTGWKDAALLGLSALLLKKKPGLFLLIAAVGAAFMAAGRLLAIKEVVLPTIVSALLWVFRAEVRGFYQRHARTLRGALIGIVTVLLAVGAGELWYRTGEDIHADNWNDYEYLLANNQYRCGKLAITSAAPENDLHECLGTQFNFYKISYRDENYEALQSLFLPIGDSVVFGVLLFNMLGLLLFEKAGSRLSQPGTVVLAVFVCWGVFFTLNRFTSLFALVLMVGYFVMGRHTWRQLMDAQVAIALVIGAYVSRSDYLMGSLLSEDTPSNLEHAAFMEFYLPALTQYVTEHGAGLLAALSVGALALLVLSLRVLRARGCASVFVIAYLAGLVLYGGVAALSALPVSLFGMEDSPLPAESNILKVMLNHGFLGFLLYNGMMALLVTGSQHVWRRWRRGKRMGREDMQQRWVFWMLTAHTLLYQLISPYVVSGFVTFAFFMAVWTIMFVELELRREELVWHA